jgi:hypothetical protein
VWKGKTSRELALGCIAFLALSCAGQRPPGSSAREEKGASSKESICGLNLPCAEAAGGQESLYAAMVESAEVSQSKLLSMDKPRGGCFTCLEPKDVFASEEKDPEAARELLMHVHLSLKAVAGDAFSESKPSSMDSVLGDLGAWSLGALQKAGESKTQVDCALLTAYCASMPGFGEAFVKFASAVLFQEPGDEDPGFVKEATVELALAFNPPGALPVICSFVKSGAKVRARMKAVRDLCAYKDRKEVMETLQWVIDHDPDLKERAQACFQ